VGGGLVGWLPSTRRQGAWVCSRSNQGARSEHKAHGSCPVLLLGFFNHRGIGWVARCRHAPLKVGNFVGVVGVDGFSEISANCLDSEVPYRRSLSSLERS